MSQGLPHHPVSEILPTIEGDEFLALVEDIKANGLLEPIWLHDGQVIDGRNRQRACLKAGVEPRYREWEGKGSLVAFVMSQNLHRRHLTASQRAAIAVQMMPHLEREAKERQRQGGVSGGLASGESRRGEPKVRAILPEPSSEADRPREQAAQTAGVSARYVQEAKKVQAKAPELLERVREGKLNLNQAVREVKRQEKIEELHAKAEAVAAEEQGDRWEIRHGDCVEELSCVKAGTVRLVFADPPYNVGVDYGDGEGADRLPDQEFVRWLRTWFDGSYRVLTDDGSLWLLISDEFACEAGVELKRAGFAIRDWVKWYEGFGVNCASKFNRCTRHLFHAVKHPKRFVFNEDAVSRPSDRQAKYNDARANPSGKILDDCWFDIPRLAGTHTERIPTFPTQLPLALLLRIVGCASEPGDLVLDPFNGSGTTGVAALRLGRRYLGIEKQAHFKELATARLKGEPYGSQPGERA